MKVKLAVTLEVDAKEWEYIYSVDKSEVRADVLTYFIGTLRDQIEHASLPVEIVKENA